MKKKKGLIFVWKCENTSKIIFWGEKKSNSEKIPGHTQKKKKKSTKKLTTLKYHLQASNKHNCVL